MSATRLIALAAVLLGLGAVVVTLRAKQTRLTYETACLEAQALKLQRTVWQQQLEIARLRSPARLVDRTVHMQIAVYPPGEKRTPWN